MDYYINWGLCNLPTFKLPDVDIDLCFLVWVWGLEKEICTALDDAIKAGSTFFRANKISLFVGILYCYEAIVWCTIDVLCTRWKKTYFGYFLPNNNLRSSKNSNLTITGLSRLKPVISWRILRHAYISPRLCFKQRYSRFGFCDDKFDFVSFLLPYSCTFSNKFGLS